MQLKDKLIDAFNRASDNGLSFKAIRSASMRQFETTGFPSIRDEEWKYTNLLPIIKRDYSLDLQEERITLEELSEYVLTDTDTYFLVFVNGILSEELSTLENGSFVISTLKIAQHTHSEIVAQHWNNCLPKETDALVAMNTALAEDGAFIYVPKNTVVDKPIQLVYATKGLVENSFIQSRSLVVAEENAQVRFTQRHQNFDGKSIFTNAVTEISAAKNAQVDCYKIQNDNRNSSLIDNTWVQQAKRSNCTVDTFSFGGQFIRNNLSFILNGSHAESNMNGISMIGQDQLVDHHTFVDHAVPNCQSNELYKGIFGDNSKGVFNGKVMVRPDAQKTNAFQANNNLLLTDNASIDTKPQLEIYADDVACSHGCTIGQLDEEALFYMRSRGIAKKEAKALLMYAFTNDVLENIKIPELQNKLNRIIANKLGVQLDLEI